MMASASAVQEQEQSIEALSSTSTISWLASYIINYGSISKERKNDTVELTSPIHHDANGEEKPIQVEATSSSPTPLLDIKESMWWNAWAWNSWAWDAFNTESYWRRAFVLRPMPWKFCY
jgi:hypothetical protein